MSQKRTRPITRQNYDHLSRWYDLFSTSEWRFCETGLCPLDVRPGENVLEIGFGTGHGLIELSSAIGGNGSVCGIDLSPGMCSISHRRVQQAGKDERIFLFSIIQTMEERLWGLPVEAFVANKS